MSKEHKLNYLALAVLIVLISMISYLVAVNWSRGSEKGLQCIYNCDNYKEVLETLK